MLRRTCTDGFLVLHEGRIVAEEYFNGMTPATRHLLMSVSKSIIGMLAGIVIGRGALSADDLVTDVVTELRGTSFEQATVRHLLDMRTGTRFSEDYDDPQSDVCRSERVADWGPLLPGEESSGLYGYVPTLGNARDHGGAFEYRSILTDVLGWVLARASGQSLPELLSSALWAPLGAEEDADMTVDRHGCPWVDGGICVTLRDLARLGQLHLQDGWLDGRQIVPAEWVRDTRTGGADSRDGVRGERVGRDAPGRLLPQPVLGRPPRGRCVHRMGHPRAVPLHRRARPRGDRQALHAAAGARPGGLGGPGGGAGRDRGVALTAVTT